MSEAALPYQRFGVDAAWFPLAVLTHNVLTALKRLALPPELLRARRTRLRLVPGWNRFTHWLPSICQLPAPQPA